MDRVAADPDAGGLAKTGLSGLPDRFVGQGAGAGDDADLAGQVDMAGHDAHLAAAGSDHARTVGADQIDIRIAGLQGRLDLQHVRHRNAFGDAGDHLDAGIGRFQDGIAGERGRHVDHARIGAGGGDRFVHGVEHRLAQVGATALAGADAADQIGAVSDGLFSVEGALRAGEPLADNLGVFVDQNTHGALIPLMR